MTVRLGRPAGGEGELVTGDRAQRQADQSPSGAGVAHDHLRPRLELAHICYQFQIELCLGMRLTHHKESFVALALCGTSSKYLMH